MAVWTGKRTEEGRKDLGRFCIGLECDCIRRVAKGYILNACVAAFSGRPACSAAWRGVSCHPPVTRNSATSIYLPRGDASTTSMATPTLPRKVASRAPATRRVCEWVSDLCCCFPFHLNHLLGCFGCARVGRSFVYAAFFPSLKSLTCQAGAASKSGYERMGYLEALQTGSRGREWREPTVLQPPARLRRSASHRPRLASLPKREPRSCCRPSNLNFGRMILICLLPFSASMPSRGRRLVWLVEMSTGQTQTPASMALVSIYGDSHVCNKLSTHVLTARLDCD